ncbi:MAG: serine hydrolase domain-containing protein [Pseudomonadota bacterium]
MTIEIAEAPVPEQDVAGPLLEHTRAMADKWVNNDKFAPGIVIAVGSAANHRAGVKVGKVATDAAAPAVEFDSLWRQYSMTKLVTSIAAMTLIDSGAMTMDDPIHKFIPDFKNMNILGERAGTGHIGASIKTLTPARNPITVRNLITHTAGMGYSMDTGPLEELYFREGINPWQIDRIEEDAIRWFRPTPLQTFAKKVATLPLFAEPGTVWAYSIGLDVLAAVVEVVAGKPFEDYVQDKIFGPLAMGSSFWQVPESDRGRMSSSYLPESDPAKLLLLDSRENSVWYVAPSFPYGGAGLVMSAIDYDELLRMLMNGGALGDARVLSPGAVDTMFSNLLAPMTGINLDQLYKMVRNPNVTFGAGGYVTTKPDPGNGRAAGTYGWGGFAGTCFWIDRAKGVRANGMINVVPHETDHAVVAMVSSLIPAVYADLTPNG